MTHGFDRAVIANGRGSLQFLQKLYDTSGQCLECDLRTCSPVEGINKDISFVHNVFAFIKREVSICNLIEFLHFRESIPQLCSSCISQT